MTDDIKQWSIVRVYNRHGWDRWAVYCGRSCHYMTKAGHWGRPIDGAEFTTEAEAIEHAQKHAPKLKLLEGGGQ